METRGDFIWLPREDQEKLAVKARARYAQLGVADRFRYETYDGGHVFSKDKREESYAWLDRWLKSHYPLPRKGTLGVPFWQTALGAASIPRDTGHSGRSAPECYCQAPLDWGYDFRPTTSRQVRVGLYVPVSAYSGIPRWQGPPGST